MECCSILHKITPEQKRIDNWNNLIFSQNKNLKNQKNLLKKLKKIRKNLNGQMIRADREVVLEEFVVATSVKYRKMMFVLIVFPQRIILIQNQIKFQCIYNYKKKKFQYLLLKLLVLAQAVSPLGVWLPIINSFMKMRLLNSMSSARIKMSRIRSREVAFSSR